MFRNSIKEMGEPSLEEAVIPKRDSLSRLHDALKSAYMDEHVRGYGFPIEKFNYLWVFDDFVLHFGASSISNDNVRRIFHMYIVY